MQQQRQPTNKRAAAGGRFMIKLGTIEVKLICSLVLLLSVRLGIQTRRLFDHDLGMSSSDYPNVNDGMRKPLQLQRINLEQWAKTALGVNMSNFTNIDTCYIGNVKISVPKVPSFIIIGAQKGGTTSLFGYLLKHPNVAPTMNWKTSRGKKHEVHFFDFEWIKLEKEKGRSVFRTEEEFYCYARKRYVDSNFDAKRILRQQMKGNELVSFDKTPRYLLRLNIPDRIRKVCPWITKLIAVLRNPVDRAFSEYNMDMMVSKKEIGSPNAFDELIREELSHLQENGLVREEYGDFSAVTEIIPPDLSPEQEEWVFIRVEPKKPRYIKRGMYAIQLQSWGKTFPLHDSLLVVNADDFHHGGERETFQRVLRHVGLPDYDLPEYEQYHSRPYEFAMLPRTRALLEAFYRPYNERLAGLLGEEWKGVWKGSAASPSEEQ